MKKYRKRKQNGITLISLVVTIVILIILSGVSLHILVGNNGIIEKAKFAKKQYNKEYITENIEIAKLNLKLNDQKVNATNIVTYLIENEMIKQQEVEILEDEENRDIEIIKIENLEFPIPIPKITLYFERPETWNVGNIYAYVWDPTNNSEYLPYPGIQAELVAGTTNIYYYTVPEKYENTKICFNNGITSGTNKMQTVDLDIPDEGNYIFRNTDATSRDIYFIMNWEYCNIYIWNNTNPNNVIQKEVWPGESIVHYDKIGDYYYYKYSLPEEYNMFIFVKMDESKKVKGQTQDFKFLGGNKVYRTDGNTSIMSNGFWEKY